MSERREAFRKAAECVSKRREAYATAAKLNHQHGFDDSSIVLSNIALELGDIQAELIEMSTQLQEGGE